MGDPIGRMILFGLILCIVAIQASQRKIESQLLEVQRRLRAISDHLSVNVDAGVPPEVVALMQAGQKIQAIKAYRAATGAGLAEAKEAVERIEPPLKSSGM